MTDRSARFVEDRFYSVSDKGSGHFPDYKEDQNGRDYIDR